jgi:hypothetical protein
MSAPHQMQFIFRYPTSKPELMPMNIDSSSNWSVKEYSPNNDTISCWLKGSFPDTLRFRVSDRGQIIDTLEVPTLFKLKTTGRKNQVVDTVLRFQSVTSRTGFLEWNSDLLLTFAYPLASFEEGRVRLAIGGHQDTISPEMEYADQVHRKVRVKFAWKTGEDYTLFYPSGVFKSMYGEINDSTKAAFKLRSKEEYGVFHMQVNLSNEEHPVIIQLLNEKGTVIQQHSITKSQKLDFGFLAPAKYGLKAIYDKNGNGKWDTGVFIKKLQPEKVSINPKTYQVRGNWELEEEWDL